MLACCLADLMISTCCSSCVHSWGSDVLNLCESYRYLATGRVISNYYILALSSNPSSPKLMSRLERPHHFLISHQFIFCYGANSGTLPCCNLRVSKSKFQLFLIEKNNFYQLFLVLSTHFVSSRSYRWSKFIVSCIAWAIFYRA